MIFVVMAVGPLVAGFLLDLLLGDPSWLYHPVRLMGKLITALESRLRKNLPRTVEKERLAGRILTLLCVLIALVAAEVLLVVATNLGPWVWFGAQTILCYQMIAARDLIAHSRRVGKGLKNNDLPAARQALSMIVGRDTQSLDEKAIVRGTVETVAENTSDGVVAPLFYMTLGGATMGVVYKMINTLDSMVGYKNEKYFNFGRFAAKLDDIAGWIPSRFGALCMIAAAGLCGLSARGAARIWQRDKRNHPSPNSAQTEAACAGALGIRLGGSSVYGGVLVPKPTIGDDIRPPQVEDIGGANRLMVLTSLIALILCSLLRLLILWLRLNIF